MKPKNPNPFYMVYQSFWTELRLKGAVKEVFAVIYSRCASLDRSLSFSRIDKVLTGGMNIDSNGQSQAPSAHESHSHEQNHLMTSDLANIASELAIGLISSGQEKKSEEQDLAPRKKRGPRL